MAFTRKAKKSKLEQSFEDLDKAIAAKRAHVQKYKHIYAQGAEHDDAVSTLQAQIKEQLAAEYRGAAPGVKKVYEGASVLVTVTPSNDRVLDHERMLAEQRELLTELGAITVVPAVAAHEEVNMKVLDEAVRKKVVDKATVDQYIAAGDARTPAVSFKQPEPKTTEKES